jgi:hypothetical protein
VHPRAFRAGWSNDDREQCRESAVIGFDACFRTEEVARRSSWRRAAANGRWPRHQWLWAASRSSSVRLRSTPHTGIADAGGTATHAWRLSNSSHGAPRRKSGAGSGHDVKPDAPSRIRCQDRRTAAIKWRKDNAEGSETWLSKQEIWLYSSLMASRTNSHPSLSLWPTAASHPG